MEHDVCYSTYVVQEPATALHTNMNICAYYVHTTSFEEDEHFYALDKTLKKVTKARATTSPVVV